MSKPKPPAKVNNYKVNKPIVAKSRNIQPSIYIKPREVEEVKQVVNGKVADEKLIHKAGKKAPAPKPPVIVKGGKNGQKQNTRQRTKQGSRDIEEEGKRDSSTPSRRRKSNKSRS